MKVHLTHFILVGCVGLEGEGRAQGLILSQLLPSWPKQLPPFADSKAISRREVLSQMPVPQVKVNG